MIDIVYTGDVRSTPEVSKQNHQMFFDEISKVSKYQIHDFTSPKGERNFTPCPFDRGGKDEYWIKDKLRRGQGGGVQVWQFMNAVKLTKNPYVIRMRTDNWFTKKSIKIILKELKAIMNNEYEIGFFGSNWLEGAIGEEHEKILLTKKGELEVPIRTEDFLIISKRDGLKNFDETINGLIAIKGANGIRSGNKCFRFIIPQKSEAYKHLCQIYLMRNTYNKGYPTDKQVCYDYLMSYCKSEHEAGKMEPSLEWWRNKEWK